jgi:hypothetical protein
VSGREVVDEEYVWTHEELRAARLRPLEPIDDPALTLPPFRRAWLNEWTTTCGEPTDTEGGTP